MPFTSLSRVLFRSRLAGVLLVVVGLAASAALYIEARRNEDLRVREDVKRRADTRHILIRETIEGYVESLHSLRNLVGALAIVEADKFNVIARDAIARHPGFHALQWVPCPPAQTDADAKATDDNGHNRGSPLSYLPVQFNEAVASAADGLVSYDYAASPIAHFFENARTTRRLVVTPTTDLPTISGEKAVLMIYPVFQAKNAASPSAVCTGFVVGVFRVSTLFGESWKQFAGQVADVMFLDATPGTPAGNRVMFYWAAERGETAAVPTEAEFRASSWYREIPIQIGGRVWLLLHRAKDGWFDRQRTYIPPVILMGGILFTFLCAAYVRSAVRRAAIVEKEVQSRTTELRQAQAQLEEDITRREEAENLLRASQQQLKGLMENSPNAIFVKDPEGRYLSVNRRYAELHGRQREDFLGHSDFDVFPPETAARMRMSDARVISTGQPVELEDTFAVAGNTHTSIVHKFPIIDEEGRVHGLCGIATEISERKRAEAEIRENRRQLEAILGQLPGMAFRMVHDGEFTPVYISRGALGLTGHSARDFLEKVVSLHEIVHPDDRETARSAINNAVKKRRSYEIEYRIVDRTGRVKWVLDRGQGVYNEDGRLLFIEGLAIDITQRKDAESEKLIVERRLLEGQKLESIGVLAGGIAHDFNNLLTGIIGNANLAALELPKTSPAHQNLKHIENASLRAAELCQQMLAYAGKGRFVIQRLELGPLVESTVPLLRASISKRATLRFQLQPDLPPIMADSTQMRQIVMNLVINASEALGEQDGMISLSTSLVRPGPGFFEGSVLAPAETAGEFVQLEVADTGAGMTPETIAKIFDPFFTTKFAGRGLGLAAVQGIIRSHHGGLKVRSNPGRGSTFTLYLPSASPAPADPTPSRRTTATPWKQQGRALVIDDEDHVLKVTAGMLQSCGMQTELARDGYEGIDLFRAHPNEFDLVLLDMTMPRLSGEETLQLLREIRPDVRVLFMSGYNRREVVSSLGTTEEIGFIQKPFTLDSLREQIQAMLS
jgi:PAS domain S-box-containing protein